MKKLKKISFSKIFNDLFGFEKDMITNANPNRLVYNVGDEIQFRTTSKSQVKHFNIVAYNDLIFKQNIKK